MILGLSLSLGSVVTITRCVSNNSKMWHRQTLDKVPAARNNEEWTCNTDCDCVPCSPYCNTYGWCQEDTGDGRRLIRTSECLQQRGSWVMTTKHWINVIISWLKPENNNGLRNVWIKGNVGGLKMTRIECLVSCIASKILTIWNQSYLKLCEINFKFFI